jgi:hypothetical protein
LIPIVGFEFDIIFLIAPAIIFGFIYIIQSRRYSKIMTQLINTK